MSYGWEIDPPYKAYDVYESCFNREDELEREEPEYDHDEKLVWGLEDGGVISRRELKAKAICYSVAVFLLISSYFSGSFNEGLIRLIGCLSWYGLGRFSFTWIDKLPKGRENDGD